ncbi:MAG: SURF1 family protein [Microbacterium sp.]|uniref:SURF1 family protein n=1 Tax=Microbacterium sp. TaxID=51671 RepID=UPI0039E5FBF3
MLRPRWLGMLALCLVVAGVFAWLGQWQLGRALATPAAEETSSESVVPIDDVIAPGEGLLDTDEGQRVEVTGTFVADDFIVVSSRYNDDVEGYWITAQLRRDDTAEPTSIAVALGWTADAAAASAAATALETQADADPDATVTVTGRLIADEGPSLPTGGDPLELTTMSPVSLLGRWHDVDALNVYRPYLVSDTAFAGLAQIDSPAPESGTSVNWLNIFYAVEWAVFAGFAFYLWYRLAKDAWEKELEELAEGADAAS